MIVDFQHHYTPPELQQANPGAVSVCLDADGNPAFLQNPLLSDLDAHIRMMDCAGIDAALLSSAPGFDQPDLATCRLINDRMKQAEQDFPGRFIGLAHVPALHPDAAVTELKRCAVELGFPGVAIATEMQGQTLDADALRPFWKTAADLGLYVFVHPLGAVIPWKPVHADDLGRMLGWEFSLMVAVMRLINGGVLDAFPTLKIQFAHFGGGIGRYRGRLRGFQQREKWGTAELPRHGRRPRASLDHYLDDRLFYDCAGWAGPDHAAQWGTEWVGFGLREVPPRQVVFATDYPQAVREDHEVAEYVAAVRVLGPDASAVLDGTHAEKLIPDLRARLDKRTASRRSAGTAQSALRRN